MSSILSPSRLALLLASLLASGSALAGELQLNLGGLQVKDTGFGLVSKDNTLNSLGLRLRLPMKLPMLELMGGYTYAGSSRSTSNYYDEIFQGDTVYDYMDNRLGIHTLEVGVRLRRPLLPWLEPYLGLSARGMVGTLTSEDTTTGWSLADPTDPSGEETLYEVKPSRDVGIGGTFYASVGVRFMPGKPLQAKRYAMRFPDEAPRGDATPAPVPPVSPAPPAPTATPPETGSSAPAAPSLEASPAPAAPVTPAATPEADTVAAGSANVQTRTHRPRRTRWGIGAEVGYGLSSGLIFWESGELSLSGWQVQGGLAVEF